MNHNKINNENMQKLAEELKTHLPGCGFALLAFDLEGGATRGNYISNVNDEFMIQMLENQLLILKEKSAAVSQPSKVRNL